MPCLRSKRKSLVRLANNEQDPSGSQTPDMKDIEQALIGTALPYWEAEAAIVRRFFQSKPTREDHIFWLKAQLWKELHPVDGYFTGLQKELHQLVTVFPEIDKAIDRHRYHSLLEASLDRSSITTCSWPTCWNILWAGRFPPTILFNSRRRKGYLISAEIMRIRVRPLIKPLCSLLKAAALGCFAKEES